MARRARGSLMGDPPPRVIESRVGPRGGRVARRACARGRESGSSMVRNCPAQRRGALPVGRMATVAIGRGRIGSRVAKVAGDRRMRAGQCKTGRAVVKCRAQPRGGGMAGRASGGVTQGNVVRH